MTEQGVGRYPLDADSILLCHLCFFLFAYLVEWRV